MDPANFGRAEYKDGVLQVLLPLSGMGSWMLVVCGALMSMHVLGINLTPLLTVGGISGIVVGLSAQALLGNMISGLNLVRFALTRPAKFPFLIWTFSETAEILCSVYRIPVVHI